MQSEYFMLRYAEDMSILTQKHLLRNDMIRAKVQESHNYKHIMETKCCVKKIILYDKKSILHKTFQ